MSSLRRQQKQRRIDEILRSAALLFRSKGFDETTIEDIAAEAVVAPATVYNYFGTKQALLRSLMAQHIEERWVYRRPFLTDPPTDPRVAVHEFVDLLLDSSLDRLTREMWRKVIAADIADLNEKPEMIGKVTHALLAQFHMLYAELRKRGSLPADLPVKEFAEASLGIADFHFYRMIGDRNLSIARTKARIKQQLDLLLRGLK